MKWMLRWDIPPSVRWSEQDEVHMDIRYEFIFSHEMYRFRYTPLLFFRWGEHRHQIWIHIFRWSVQIQIYPPLFHMRWTWISDMSSYVQMMCSDSDIPPRWSQLGQLVRWSTHAHQIYISWNVGNISYPYKKMNCKLTYLGEHCSKKSLI